MKRNKKIIFAWSVFVVVIIAFFTGVECYHYFKHANAQSYQYRILISEDVSAAEEKTESKDNANENTQKNAEPELYEETKCGMLPKISPDGMRVLDVFAAHIDSKITDQKINTVIIINDEKYDDFNERLNKLGANKVSFVVPHYVKQVTELVKAIREKGHEVFVQLPTQSSIPVDKKNSVSPLLANASAEDTVLKLDCVLATTKYIVGVANISSTLLTKSKKDMGIILDELSKRGVAFLDIEKMDEDLLAQNQGAVCFSNFVMFDGNLKVEDLKDKNGVFVPLKLLDEFLKFSKDKALVPVTSGLKNADL